MHLESLVFFLTGESINSIGFFESIFVARGIRYLRIHLEFSRSKSLHFHADTIFLLFMT